MHISERKVVRANVDFKLRDIFHGPLSINGKGGSAVVLDTEQLRISNSSFVNERIPLE